MTVVIDSRADINLENFQRVAWEGQRVALSERCRERIRMCRDAFVNLLEGDPTLAVYGVTTGYGQNVKVELTKEQRKAQAMRPVHPAMASFGEPLPQRVARGIVFARLANIVEGHAAITVALADAVVALLDRQLPSVPALGNGGAGEILPLSHLFGSLTEAFPLGEKEGLALVNGSPCASALIADALLAGKRRLDLAVQVFALAAEALKAPLEHYDEHLDTLWCDPHEATVLAQLRDCLNGANSDRRPYQAPVSWRIVPRVMGQARRAIVQAEEVAAESLQSVSDNPVFVFPDGDYPSGRVLSNGGFHNAKAYPALDNLAACWADLALLCDRQITKLLDGNVSLLPHQLLQGDGYLGCLGFAAAGYAEQARTSAQRTFLPAGEGGGFGQNDVAVPTFSAWRKEAEAGSCLVACLAILAATSSQAFYVTGREAPPRLTTLLEQVREAFPPVVKARPPGPDAEQLTKRFAAHVFTASR